MKEGAAFQAAGASQQTVESPRGPDTPTSPEAIVEAEKPRAKSKNAVSVKGLSFARFFTEEGVDPFDEIEWELRAAVIGNERGECRFRTARRGAPQALVAAGNEYRRLKAISWSDRHTQSRAQRSPVGRSRRRHDHRVGACAELLCH